jgi:NAD+ synthase (glutamine-hydrolysing)
MTEAENTMEFEKPTTDYLRVATVSSEVALADVPANVTALSSAYEAAKAEQAELLVTPELSLTGYSTADLFHTSHLLERTEQGLIELAKVTEDGPALLVGAPLRHRGLLYNCAVMLAEGRVAGVVPKVHLPNYKEFYERRWFTSGSDVRSETISVGQESDIPFGTDLLWEVNGTKVAAEVCEDMFAPISPATQAALSGAEVIANLSASNEVIGKADYRRKLVSSFCGRLTCAYVYASAGRGESVADVIYGGHQIINENGRTLAERPPLSEDSGILLADIDRSYLEHDRLDNMTFAEQARAMRQDVRLINLSVPRSTDNELVRYVDAHPFVPSNPETLDQRCEEIFSYMAHGLGQRVSEKNSQALVIGLSGGLDSTLALLTALQTTKLLGKPADFIHTITMPAQASSERTQDNASLLAEALGTAHKIIPVQELTDALLADIGHDQATQDLTYENTQARTRTNILMNYANMVKGMVQGTGDMSEAANGFCTFNGDHMSMFNPNGGVPKTLVRHLIQWFAENRADDAVRERLRDILDTPVSPELTGSGDLSQTTEDIVGPYELADFFLFEMNRHGSRPDKISYLAQEAFGDAYDQATINKWLGTFLDRFTGAQWKRDVMPNTLKIGTIALSPRGDLRMAPNTSPDWYK